MGMQRRVIRTIMWSSVTSQDVPTVVHNVRGDTRVMMGGGPYVGQALFLMVLLVSWLSNELYPLV